MDLSLIYRSQFNRFFYKYCTEAYSQFTALVGIVILFRTMYKNATKFHFIILNFHIIFNNALKYIAI